MALKLVILDPKPWLNTTTFHFSSPSESLVQRLALPSTGILILNRKDTINLKILKGRNFNWVGSTKKISQRGSLYFSVGIHLQCAPSDIEGQKIPTYSSYRLQKRQPALYGPFPTISMWQNLKYTMSRPSKTTKTVWRVLISSRSVTKMTRKMGVQGLAPSKVRLTMQTMPETSQKQCLWSSSMMTRLSRQKRKSSSFSRRKQCLCILVLLHHEGRVYKLKLTLAISCVQGRGGAQRSLLARGKNSYRLILLIMINKSQKVLVEGLVLSGVIRNAEVQKVMASVDRRYYSPSFPYEDSPQTIGYGATISAPHMHAYALELLHSRLVSAHTALDVGSGTGYLTAAMALSMPPGAKVYGIEHVPELVKKSIENIKKGNPEVMDKIKIEVGDGRMGWTKDKDIKFDVIHVGAAAQKTPAALLQQLAEGGLMIIPVGGQHETQKFVQISKTQGKISEKFILNVRYVPLTDLKKQLY